MISNINHTSVVLSVSTIELGFILITVLVIVLLHRRLNAGPDLREEIMQIREAQAQDRSNMENVAMILGIRQIVTGRAALTVKVNQTLKRLVKDIAADIERDDDEMH